MFDHGNHTISTERADINGALGPWWCDIPTQGPSLPNLYTQISDLAAAVTTNRQWPNLLLPLLYHDEAHLNMYTKQEGQAIVTVLAQERTCAATGQALHVASLAVVDDHSSRGVPFDPISVHQQVTYSVTYPGLDEAVVGLRPCLQGQHSKLYIDMHMHIQGHTYTRIFTSTCMPFNLQNVRLLINKSPTG